METNMILYHGSKDIITRPEFGTGSPYNDYGRGFYCTESLDLAREWACLENRDGFANKYAMDLNGLSIMNLTDGSYNILNWLSLLLANRKFSITANIARQAKNYLLNIKLQKSKELIRQSQYTISEIAYMLGFSSIHYFSRLFKKYFNTTPSAYAKKIAETQRKQQNEHQV